MRKPALTNITILLISLFLSSVVGSGFQTGNQVRFTELKALLPADGDVSLQLIPYSQGYTSTSVLGGYITCE